MGCFFSPFVSIYGHIHAFSVLRSQLEYVSDLYSSFQGQLFTTMDAGILFTDLCNITVGYSF